jgi:hypothetical protein
MEFEQTVIHGPRFGVGVYTNRGRSDSDGRGFERSTAKQRRRTHQAYQRGLCTQNTLGSPFVFTYSDFGTLLLGNYPL